MQSAMGRLLLPVLRAELLKREGGGVEISTSDLRTENRESFTADGKFEKVFGADSYVTFEWYQTGIDRCRAVACVRKEMGEGFGTGFLVKGADLHPSLGEEFLLLTNSHVISDDAQVQGALRPDEAYISFEALGLNDYLVKEVIWTSPPTELDATLIRLDRPVTGVQPYPVAPRLPMADGKQRIYVVGHPKGGKLSFSLHDNLLLDHQAPRIHYRTPTEGGSSGSPVFNQQWRLVGIHHLGNSQMPKLNGQIGTYEANEGIWITSIKEALAGKLAENNET
jgi:S1-C subfamily serine protease